MSPEQARPQATAPRRRTADRRWSASSTVEFYDDAGFLHGPAGTALKGKVRWRVAGKNKKRTFSGPGFVADIGAFRALLTAAFEGDWPSSVHVGDSLESPCARRGKPILSPAG